MKADGDAGTAVDSATRVLALAQKLHDEYVAAGEDTREKLISEGQSSHDQVVAEATARQEELLSTGQAKYDELVSAGEAKHDAHIAEAEALVAEAQQKRAQLLYELEGERGVWQKQIEELRAFERDHHAYLKSYLQGQLITLEQLDADETRLADSERPQALAPVAIGPTRPLTAAGEVFPASSTEPRASRGPSRT